MADEKTIATWEQVYTSVNGPQVEAEMKRIIKLLEKIQTVSAKALTGNLQGAAQSATLKASDKKVQSINKEIAAYERLISARQKLDRLRGDLGGGAHIPSKMEEARAESMSSTFGGRRFTEQEVDKGLGLDRARMRAQATPAQMVEYQAMRFQQVFRRVTDALVSFYVLRGITTVVGGFFKSLIDTNIQLENMDVRLKIMVGNQGAIGQLKRTILDLTVKTPFIIKDFTQAAVSLQAFGINATQNLKPVADWAAAMGRDLEDVALAYAKITSGSPRAALLLSTRGISKAEYDAELKKTHDGITALNAIIERKFGDMSFEVSKTFEGIVSNIKDMWFQIAAQLGKPLFSAMENDIKGIFGLMGGLKDQSIWLTAFGEVIANIYTLLKSALIPAIGIGLTIALVKAYNAFKGFQAILSVTQASLVSFASRAGAVIGTLLLMVSVFSRAESINRDYIQSIEDSRHTLAVYGEGHAKHIQALKDEKAASDQVINSWEGRLRMIAKDPLSPDKWKAQTVAIQEQIEALGKQIEYEERLKQAREDSFSRQATKFDATDILELQDEIKKKVPGAQKVVEALKNSLSKILGKSTSSTVNAHNIVDGKILGDIGDLTPQGEGNVRSAIGLLKDLTDAKLKDRTVSEALAQTTSIAKAVASSRDLASAQKLVHEFFSSIADADKDVKPLKDFSAILAEIAGLKERLNELNKGEPPLFGKIAENKTAIEGLQVILEGGKNVKPFWETHKRDSAGLTEFYELNKKLLTHQIALKEEESQYDKEFATAQIRYGELRANQSSKQMGLDQARLNYNYEAEGNLDALYQERQMELDNINNKLAEQKVFISEQKDATSKIADNDKLGRLVQATKIMQAEGEVLELQKQQYQVMLAIEKLPGRTIVEGMGNAIDDVRDSLNKFNDDLGKIVVGGIQQMGGGYLSDLLFGNKEMTSSNNALNNLKAQLTGVQMEADRAYRNASVINRRDGETNDQYLTRAKMAAQVNSISAVQYSYKTKELEVLEQINKAEAERSQILLKRLADFGDKVMGKLEDQLAGMAVTGLGNLFKGIFTGGGGASSPYDSGINPTLIPDDSGFIGPQSGGIHVHAQNIYGYQDFQNAVDSAVQSNSRRSSR